MWLIKFDIAVITFEPHLSGFPHPVTHTTKGVTVVFGPQNTLGPGAIVPAAPSQWACQHAGTPKSEVK